MQNKSTVYSAAETDNLRGQSRAVAGHDWSQN